MTTTATDKLDLDKVLAPTGGIVVDEVTIDGLTVGSSYVVNGQLVDKATRTPVGSAVAVNFTATAPHAVVRVEIPVGPQQPGRTLVAFEKLTLNGVQVGQHEDLQSEAQTVVVQAQDPVSTESPAPGPSSSAEPTASASPEPHETSVPSSTPTVPSPVDQPATQDTPGLANTGSALEGIGLLGATALVAGGAWAARRRR